MSLKKIINKTLFGITLPQEFICVDSSDFISPLRIFLKNSNKQSTEISYNEQLFLGYKPLIIGLTAEKNSERYSQLIENSSVSLEFYHNNWRVAKLNLEKFRSYDKQNKTIFLYEGVSGFHHFQSWVHFMLNDFKYRLTADKKSNVYLDGNLFKQVIVAYSFPRLISLISLSDGKYSNVFPTDLNGFFGMSDYIVSLRIGGKAGSQVEKVGKIIISRLEVKSCGFVYNLSKNHMQDLQDESEFNFRKERSINFNFPVPESAVEYSELELYDSFEAGIHKLYFFKVIQTEIINQSTSRLSHIHRVYAEWRKKNSLKTEYFIR